ncbi:GerAB/ArcD/ProY family transporter [Aeribacillus composti]|uniref:GerAB/ArcD/ProY family transporter n=1 Tax=Aeribacillus composti TaxID=1868734 RepID=UPI002E1F3177|nr:GerAB/ArcD/ProY family transporter [Aeribacillus composti]
MEKAKIDGLQMFSFMFLFQFGSLIVTGLGLEVKQNNWIAVLVVSGINILLILLIYGPIYNRFPNLTLTGIFLENTGKIVGTVLSIIYNFYFILIAGFILRDTGDNMIKYLLPETPIEVVLLMGVLLISYSCFLGIEVFARVAQLLFFIMITLGIMGNFLVFASGIVDPIHLLPILEDGLFPLIKAVFPSIISYSEMVVFFMILPYLNKPQNGVRIGTLSVLFSGLAVSWTFALTIAVLGVYGTELADLPLLNTAQKINVGDFFQRMDPIVILTLFIGLFVKLNIFFYAGVVGMAELFKKQKHQPFILPAAIMIFVIAIVSVENEIEKKELFKEKLPLFIELPILIIIPCILLVIIAIRGKWQKRKHLQPYSKGSMKDE